MSRRRWGRQKRRRKRKKRGRRRRRPNISSKEIQAAVCLL